LPAGHETSPGDFGMIVFRRTSQDLIAMLFYICIRQDLFVLLLDKFKQEIKRNASTY
jgi:hypothetical protein